MPQSKNMEHIFERDLYSVIGLPFDAVDLDTAKNIIYRKIDTNEKCFLSTPNLNFAIGAHADEDFYRSVAASDLCIADGMPIVWFSKLMGVPINERVAGSDLFEVIASDSSRAKKVKIFFFGGEAGAAKHACEKLNENGVGAQGCGFYDPGFVSVEEMSSTEIIAHINQCQPDFVLVALGAKKGQAWILKNMEKLDAPIISHLGAVINFVSSRIKRSPVVLQKLGLEWVWRIYQEPMLWRRYFSDGMALLGFVVTCLLPLYIYRSRMFRRGDTSAEFDASIINSTLVLSGQVGSKNIERFKAALQSLDNATKRETKNIIIDCKSLSDLSSAALAYLQVYNEILKHRGQVLVLKSVAPSVKRLVRFHWANTRFCFCE